jgi:hypothetical protein
MRSKKERYCAGEIVHEWAWLLSADGQICPLVGKESVRWWTVEDERGGLGELGDV